MIENPLAYSLLGETQIQRDPPRQAQLGVKRKTNKLSKPSREIPGPTNRFRRGLYLLKPGAGSSSRSEQLAELLSGSASMSALRPKESRLKV